MHTTLPHWTNTMSVFKSAFSALVAGSRIVPLGDNGEVIGELAARVVQYAESRATRDPFRKI